MFWLAYQTGKTRHVVIVRANFMIAARLRAALLLESSDAHFVEGHELPPAAARKVPARMIGRLLTAAGAERVVEAMEG